MGLTPRSSFGNWLEEVSSLREGGVNVNQLGVSEQR